MSAEPPGPSNSEIAAALEELGDLYELDGAVVHRVLAYRAAAKAVREAPVSVLALARRNRATELPGIGATIQEKILALDSGGAIPAAERLRARFPPGLVQLTHLPGLGPKRARLLHSELGIDSPESLRAAAEAQQLRTVKGIGPKLEATVIRALDELEGRAPAAAARILLPRAIDVATDLLAALRAAGPPDARIELAGSARRAAETVKDLDIIAATSEPERLAEAFAALEQIESVATSGAAGAKARTHSGVGVDLRIAAPENFGNLLQHFTGSGEHNAALREGAVKQGLRVSEYGIRDDRSGVTHACGTEREVYALLGLGYIEPELRENRGELLAARDGSLPALVGASDIRGDLHSHTVASDGHDSIEAMALAARALGYEYLAITDHSASHGFGDAVSPERLLAQVELVHEASARIEGIELLAGSEVNILPDGSLDYDDEHLARLDWVIASVHTSFSMGSDAMTGRIIAAMEHPLVDAIGHPTGRLIERRAAYEVDRDALFAAAARTGTMLEINANPDRRDLSEIDARAACMAGAGLLINSDAHRTATLSNMRWGLATARRAWLEPRHVLNTLTLAELRSRRKQARQHPL